MTPLTGLLDSGADIGRPVVDRLSALVAEWALLADLSFADLLLCVPLPATGSATGNEPADEFLVAAQVRPATGPTVHPEDLVGSRLTRESLSTAIREKRIVREGEPEEEDGVPVRVEAIPIPMPVGGRIVAVIARDTNLVVTRWPSPLEVAYLRCANDLALMVAEGSFPFTAPSGETLAAPRVGDGMMRLDETGVVTYASPNAVSSYRRLGHTGNLADARLREVHAGLPLRASAPERPGVDAALRRRQPQEDELDVDGIVVLLRAIPLLTGPDRGALVLVRDVTELRRREEQLLSKDATIREIHHRVKNNLQTVAALLRLQARRMTAPEARDALDESVRRVTSIALVHETLSQTLEEAVDFDAVADQITAMTVDVAATGQRPDVRRQGSFGTLPGTVATPLSLVLGELLQNAVEHGAAHAIEIRVLRTNDALDVVIADDGDGLPVDFSVERSDRLGLQIVRSLLAEMRGTFTLRPNAPIGGGAVARVSIPSLEAVAEG